MAVKRFSYAVEPHVFELGDDIKLSFLPIIDAVEFLDALEPLQTAQAAAKDDDPASLKALIVELKGFLAALQTEESKALFGGLKLPLDLLTQLSEAAVELYGGGAKERPTGQS